MKRGPIGGVLCGVLALVFSVDICQGKITSFVVSRVNDRTCNFVNNDVVLDCEVDDDSSTIAIKRLKDGVIVNTSRAGEKSIKYAIYAVSCSDMGTYECIQDNTERETADLVIADCPLQSCDGAVVQRTMFVGVGDSVQFSVCVLACKSIDPTAEFNGSLIRTKSLSNWTWDYEPITSTGLSTTRFSVCVTRNRTDTGAYGFIHVRIFSYLGKLYYLDFHIMLEPPGPPHCPTDIAVTHYGHDHVSLSWKPGLDGGSRQYFYVYYSKDNITWYTHGSKTENTTKNVSGLSSSTSYYFRVASWNQHSKPVDDSTCTGTVFVTTKHLITPAGLLEDWNSSSVLVLTLGVCSLLAVILFLTALFCWRRKVNREQTRDPSQIKEEAEEAATHDGSMTSPGEYVSDDGLKYITVYPIHDKRRKTKKKRKRQDRVQYATVDALKTQKLSLNPAPHKMA